MMQPQSLARLVWDLLCTLFTLYDAVFTPLHTFELPPSAVTCTLSWLMAAFWTLDIGASFLTGFESGGIIELRPSAVANRFLRTWFVLDIFVVLVDWTTAECQMNTIFSAAATTRAVLCTIRISVRLLRTMRFFGGVMDRISSELVYAILRTVQLLGSIVLLSHFMACAWYFIGNVYGKDFPNSWVADLEGHRSQVPSLAFRYTTAMHWSLSQFTLSSSDVAPQNALETTFASVMLVLAVVMFSLLLGTMVTATTRLRQLAEQTSTQRRFVQRYLDERGISMDLGTKVCSFLKSHGYKSHPPSKCLREIDVTAFKALPESIQRELRCEVHGPQLLRHPLLSNIKDGDQETLQKICAHAMDEVYLVPGNTLFTRDQTAYWMFVLTKGTAIYTSGAKGLNQLRVDPHHFLAEAALWMSWTYKGKLKATDTCDFAALRSEGLQEAVISSRSQGLCRRYAQHFAQAMHDRYEEGRELDDLWIGMKAADTMLARARFEQSLSSKPSKQVRFAEITPTPEGQSSAESSPHAAVGPQVPQHGNVSYYQFWLTLALPKKIFEKCRTLVSP